MLEGGLEALPYPEESTETQPGSSPEAPEAPEPVGLSLTVPDYVLLLKAPNVAIWDPTGSGPLGTRHGGPKWALYSAYRASYIL